MRVKKSALTFRLTAFDDIEWIDDATREIVERFMPDLLDRLPAKRTETSDQAFGRMRANRDCNRPKVVEILHGQKPLWQHGASNEFMTMWVAERLWYPFE